MSFNIKGKLRVVNGTQQKTDSFKSREFVIEVADDKYPQLIKFQLVQDRCDIIDEYNLGDEINVSFDLRGREWEGKYFTNLNAWRISNVVGNTEIEDENKIEDNHNFPTVGDDDLPF